MVGNSSFYNNCGFRIFRPVRIKSLKNIFTFPVIIKIRAAETDHKEIKGGNYYKHPD